jgi:hypothetical protein
MEVNSEMGDQFTQFTYKKVATPVACGAEKSFPLRAAY